LKNTRPELAVEHLLLRLRPLNRALREAVARQRAVAERLAQPGLSELCVTDEQAGVLLEEVEALAGRRAEGNAEEVGPESLTLIDGERDEEGVLRARAESVRVRLPLDELSDLMRLTPFEQTALLACAAPEVDRAYERIYAYVLDDLNRRQPCVELICALAARTHEGRLALRPALSRFGRLRRAGVLRAAGEAATDLRQELRLAPGLFEYLTGAPLDPASCFGDASEVCPAEAYEPPQGVRAEVFERLAEALAARAVTTVGVWGSRHSGKEEFVHALAAAARLPLRRLRDAELRAPGVEAERYVREAVQTAAALGALLWVETDQTEEPASASAFESLAEALSRSRVPTVLTGRSPWRPTLLLEAGGFAEFELQPPDFRARREMWARELPEAGESQLAGLAARFRLSRTEVRAAAGVARTRAEISRNGLPLTAADEIDAACATVTRRRSDHFASAVTPRRTPEDLVLPPETHQQVIEVARFFRASAVVDEQWGFGRMATGGGGLKALFTGGPGTGKTLAAEVIAGLLGLPLLKVDLARVVSKWVGETEKNLDTVFREAEESNSVLFFDEADSLFGRRGEVQRGTDRYANLEVGFLLQRLEDYFGLVVLASNLRDQIDAAFTRRFHVIIHFPPPRPEERRRIWQIAFPASSPLAEEVDFEHLKGLDLSGAGIVSAARTAAMLAVDEGSDLIRMEHIVRAVARQFRREARVLMPASVGPYASMLNETR